MNKMEAFQGDSNPQEGSKKDDELKNIKQEQDGTKMTTDNMKQVLKAHKQGHIMKGAIIEMNDKYSGVQPKLYTVI